MTSIPPEMRLDPAPLGRMYPTSRIPVELVPADPDDPVDGNQTVDDLAAARLGARAYESRGALTTGIPDAGDVTAPPAGPASLTAPLVTVGSLEQEQPKQRRRWFRRG